MFVTVNASPRAEGATAALLDLVESELTAVRRLSSSQAASDPEALRLADGIILASPVYRAGGSTELKALLDATPRGLYRGESDSVLAGKPVLLIMTGASLHHFLAVKELAGLLVSFFGAWVVPPGVYVAAPDWQAGRLDRGLEEHTRAQVQLMLALARNLATQPLPVPRPQA